MSATTEALIDAITREVLAALAGRGTGDCSDPSCQGDCAAHCSDTVRGVVLNGAGRISYSGDGAEVPRDLARFIDHTLLRPDATAADIDELCEEAGQYGFAAVCVNPVWVRRCVQNLRGSNVRVASVTGFPFGANTAEVKAMEARRAIRDGAREIDMVINVGALKSGDHDLVRRDIEKVSDACHEAGAINKVIIEAALLTDEEKVVASHLARLAKADFVKTSTGYGPGGATLEDVLLMRETVGPKLGIKAAGGIRSAEDVREMIAAGATRIGASASVEIVTGREPGNGRY
ncbi:MAG TPA: deoxyribose-phosphate aldolase [Gaiellaceae bacterium]|nr:deoxyribose-phosphate aldolase [Gaiellaceae bacterium]